MDTSDLIARFIGPVLLAAAIASFVNRKHMTAIFEDFVESPALIYLAGVLALVMGIAVVTFHNRWTADWPVIITVFGWLALIGGVMRMVFPNVAIDMGRWMIRQQAMLAVIGAINGLLGLFLTYKGFAA